MNTVLQFISDSGFVGWCIMLVGIASLALIGERAYVLYFKFGMNVDEFWNKVQTLVLARKSDEALVVAAQLQAKPIPAAFKTILEKADRDDDAIFQAHDIAMAETVPQFTKRTHYLSMFANVATLMGLLGTIHGLILSFQAVATADPSTKQALLAQGIAVSMYTTALGLVVAIPAMVAYSFLISRQNHLVDELTEKCGKLTELLTGAHMPSLTRQNIYPDNVAKDAVAASVKAPPTNHKAS
ncbi:MAG: MotA/TolQ/ExbB proton channel family protein [Proteobacteria bacterium]|jgi:biopolymer transport protein ExbB/TolQ|nr:MotA/TolQ/ExbB proton channel family protein [Pseudomonadota bacterium]